MADVPDGSGGDTSTSPPVVSADARRFARLARHLAENATRSTAGQAIAEAAVEVLGCTSAAVVRVDRGDRLTFVVPGAGADSLVQRIATIVGEVSEGPSLTAVTERRPVTVDDLAADGPGGGAEWPRYAARLLAETPVRSVLVFPLILDDELLGALALYDERPGFFTSDVRDTAEVYADHATIVYARAVAVERADSLQAALATNRAIGQAIGILMSRYRLQEPDAFDILRLASQAANRKLRDVAADVVSEGDIPAALAPGKAR